MRRSMQPIAGRPAGAVRGRRHRLQLDPPGRLRAPVPGADRAVQREVGLRPRARASPPPAGSAARRWTAPCTRCAASPTSPAPCGPARSSMSRPRRCAARRTAPNSWPRPSAPSAARSSCSPATTRPTPPRLGVAYSFYRAGRRRGRSRRRQRRPLRGDPRRADRTLWQPADRHAAGHPHAARPRRCRWRASIDERLAGVAWLGGRRRRPQLLRRGRRLAGAGAGPAGHDRHAAEGRARLPADRRGGDHARPQHRGPGRRRAADRAGHARAADRDGARGGPAARAGRAPAGARSGRVLGLRPARGPRCSCGCRRRSWRRTRCSRVPRDFGRSRSRLPEIGAAMGAWTAPSFAGETPSTAAAAARRLRGLRQRLARAPGVARARGLLPAGAVPVHRARPRRAGVHRLCRVHPLRGPARTICSSARS